MFSSDAMLPRQSMQDSCHKDVDVSLKDLRTVSRRLLTLSSPFTHELRILERIHYKGKNQHRSAKFWKKVVEIRRLGARLNELDLLCMVESLRRTFYASEAKNNTKALHGAWVHTPDAKTCHGILKRLRSACVLVDQARGRFRLGHLAFTKQLRTATFLPLTVSLIAITARLDFLLAELRSIVTLCWDTVCRILEAINVSSGSLKPGGRTLHPLNPYSSLPSSAEESSDMSRHPRKRLKLSAVVQDAEDLGSKIIPQLEPPDTTPTASYVSQKFSPQAEHLTEINPLVAQSGNPLMGSALIHDWNLSHSPPSAEHGSQRDANANTASRDIIASPRQLQFVSPVVRPMVPSNKDAGKAGFSEQAGGLPMNRKKKQKFKASKRDEIDEIFGF